MKTITIVRTLALAFAALVLATVVAVLPAPLATPYADAIGEDSCGSASCGGVEFGPIVPFIRIWDLMKHCEDCGGGGYTPPEPYCTLTLVRGPLATSADPAQFSYIITWSAPYATAFTLNNGIGPVAPPAGGTVTATLPGTVTVSGTAVTPFGNVTCHASATYEPPVYHHPPYCTLTASPNTIPEGGSATLTWTSTNATSVVIDNGIGAVAPTTTGSRAVSPLATTTYTATVTGPGGTATCRDTVVVTKKYVHPPYCTLDLTSGSIVWTTTNATNVTIVPLTNSPQVPVPVAGGASNTYSLTQIFFSPSLKIDMFANGGVSLIETISRAPAFQADKPTADRMCRVLMGNGASAGSWTKKEFHSCDDNKHYAFNGTSWSVPGACSFNQHIETLTCVGASMSGLPLDGSHTWVPPLGPGTHTYRLTATGPGGTATCEDTITNDTPKSCKLQITKSVDKSSAKAGDTLTYTINVKNVGGAACTGSGVLVTDVVDAGITFVSETHTSNIDAGYNGQPLYTAADRTLRWNAWELTPGESGTMVWTATVNPHAACSLTIPNTAKVTALEYNNFNAFELSNTVTTSVSKDCGSTPTPVCTLNVSSNNIRTGESITLSWTSSNVTSGFITNYGTTSPVSSGSQVIFPPSDTTYTGTFTGPYGTTTCSQFVKVTTGPGGCQGNCGGGGYNQPNVVLFSKPVDAPLAFVSLSKVPYTGFEAGQTLTLVFWAAVAMLAAGITYTLMGFGGAPFVLAYAYALIGTGPLPRRPRYTYEEEPVMAASVTTAPAPVMQAPVTVAPVATPYTPAVHGIPEIRDVLEARAAGAGVLMSPEAIDKALALPGERAEQLRLFGEILNKAVATLPREDGWILVSSDIFDTLSGTAVAPVVLATPDVTPSIKEILSSVAEPVTQAPAQSVVASLASSVLAGNREAAYQTVRLLEADHASVSKVMTELSTLLNDLVKARQVGGAHTLSEAAAGITDATLANITELFIHGIDLSYSNPFTGLKLAIAQAFEARG